MEIIKEKDFEEKVLKSNKTVLVDFFADWCGPCKMLSPILEQVNAETGDEVEIFKINVDENAKLARQFGIMSIPTMMIFRDGKQIERITGLRQKQQIVQALKKND